VATIDKQSLFVWRAAPLVSQPLNLHHTKTYTVGAGLRLLQLQCCQQQQDDCKIVAACFLSCGMEQGWLCEAGFIYQGLWLPLNQLGPSDIQASACLFACSAWPSAVTTVSWQLAMSQVASRSGGM
jgi:hypothetical protein